MYPVFFLRNNDPPKLKFMGLFESETAADTCIGCLKMDAPVKKKVPGTKMYKLYMREEQV